MFVDPKFLIIWALVHQRECPSAGNGEYPTDYRCRGCRKARSILGKHRQLVKECSEGEPDAEEYQG